MYSKQYKKYSSQRSEQDKDFLFELLKSQPSGRHSELSADSEGNRHEYSEICSALRHYSALRFAVLTVFFALLAGLVTVVFGDFQQNQQSINFIDKSAKIGGIFGTFIFWIFEERILSTMRYLERRVSDLEGYLGYKQYSPQRRRTFLYIKTQYATRMLYIMIGMFWVLSFFFS